MKKIVCIIAIAFAICFSLTSCKRNKIIIGTMSQPGEPYIKSIQEEYELKGYELEIRLFDSFDTPNVALEEGAIDVNLFQHEPFLNIYNSQKNSDLFCAAKLYDCVYGAYSKKISSKEELATTNVKKVTIANDASNMKRCLDILAAEKIIEVSYPATGVLDPTHVNDYITSNPYELQITPVSTASIAPSLNEADVVLGIVNATFAINAGLTSDLLICEEQDPEHINANILACRKEDKDAQWLADLVEVLTSEKSSKTLLDTFGGTIKPYFKSFLTA